MRKTYKWLYERTIDIINKKNNLPPEFVELIDMLSKRYEINVINIEFKILEKPLIPKKTCQLYVVYDGDVTASKRANINKYISILFFEVNKKYNITDTPNMIYLTVNMLHLDDIKPLEAAKPVRAEKKSVSEDAPQSAKPTAVAEKKSVEPVKLLTIKEESPLLEKPPQPVKADAVTVKKTAEPVKPLAFTEKKPAVEKPAIKEKKQKNKTADLPLFSPPERDSAPSAKSPLFDAAKRRQLIFGNDESIREPKVAVASEQIIDCSYRDISDKIFSSKGEQPKIFVDLKDFLSRKYGIYAVGFRLIHKKEDSDYAGLEISCMNNLLLENRSTEQVKTIKSEVSQHFFVLNRKYRACPDSYFRGFEILFFNLKQHLRDSINKAAAESFEKYIKAVYNTIPLFKVNSHRAATFVLFNKTKEISKSEKSGMKKLLEEEYYRFLAKTDEYGIFTLERPQIFFSSKEILDKEFGGDEQELFQTQLRNNQDGTPTI